MIHLKSPIIIAIDGYSSCGKSTFAKTIANELQYLYIDSGAMYRAITLYAIQNKIIENGKTNIAQLDKVLKLIKVAFRYDPKELKYETLLNDINVEEKIRSMEVSENVSEISKIISVRSRLVALQQKLGENKGIVMDGRDIGTVVFPNAEVKLFMTASLEVRAYRRYNELIEKGISPSLSDITANLAQRDFLDQNREISPLKKADDAILLDNSNMTPLQQMEWFKGILERFQ